jgi:hypothetical protein
VVVVVALVLSGWFFTLFDRPPGTDGGLCNNRQLQRALDDLRDTAGYRYLDTEQRQVLLSDPSTSLDDPVFGWEDTLTSEVAYLAPDRTHEVVTRIADEFQRGYLEQVRLGDQQWQLRESEDPPGWVRIDPWPTGNWAWGYVQNAMGILGTPGIASIRFGTEPVPGGLTGDGGCTIAAPGETETRIVALRVGTDGRVSDIYLGPPADAAPNRDAWRNLIELDDTLPDASEFAPPPNYVDEDVLYPAVSMPPQPTVGPLTPREGGWEPIAFPLGDQEVVSANVADVLEFGDRWTAVGSGQVGDVAFRALAWISEDGVSWDLVDSPPAFVDMSFTDLVDGGDMLLAIGYRSGTRTADGTADPDRPESWLSTDGVTWQQGGQFEKGANPGRPVWTHAGWVAGGSIWSMPDPDESSSAPSWVTQIQRPAFFTSPDGVTWTTIQPQEAAYGSIGRPEVDGDGTIRATSCETPEATNTAAGSPCFVREWTSTDGVTWTPGPASEDPGEEFVPVPAGDGFLAVAVDEETGEPELLRSDDGSTWESAPLPSDSMWPTRLVPTPEGIVLIGHSTLTSVNDASVWRSSDDGQTWEEVPLGVLDGAVGRWVDRVVVSDEGIRLVGSMALDETRSVPVLWVEP